MNAQELKLNCLNLAAETLKPTATAEAVIKAAEKFEAYVTGRDVQPQ